MLNFSQGLVKMRCNFFPHSNLRTPEFYSLKFFSIPVKNLCSLLFYVRRENNTCPLELSFSRIKLDKLNSTNIQWVISMSQVLFQGWGCMIHQRTKETLWQREKFRIALVSVMNANSVMCYQKKKKKDNECKRKSEGR